MLMGEFHHNLDEKGRITIPSKYRDELKEQFIITRGIENCLYAYKKEDFDRLYVMTSGKKISSCCFMCRQLIVEFFNKDSIITLMDMNGNYKELTVAELCPYPFDESDLNQ